MKSWEAVYQKMKDTAGITSLVSTRIYHGSRPDNDTYPAINFFQIVPANQTLIDTGGEILNPMFQISCRDTTPSGAMELSQQVGTTWHNFSGVVGSAGANFDVLFSNQLPNGGMIVEDDGDVYHVPVMIRFVYRDSTVS